MSSFQHGGRAAQDGTLLLMRDLIHDRTGIYFDATRIDVMVEKLTEPAAARNCRSLTEYYFLLKYGAGEEEEEWGRVMDALSVQETYFYREISQIQALTDVVIPGWFRNNATPLRIWSAACATGEEPYSIVMAITEAGLGDHPIRIVASDASAAAIAKARKGIYRERSFRSLPPELRKKYFTDVTGGSQLSANILNRVTFHRANITSPFEIAHLATAPVVFCRNVFIYFSPEAIQRTTAAFAARMPANGHLFVGASESLVKLTSDFELQEIEDAFVYIRKVRSLAPINA